MTRTIINTVGTSSIGGKAVGLEWLARHGARVPRTWIVAAPEEVARLELDEGKSYAVRSSAADEDTERSAAAGVYLTELNVAVDDVAAAVERVVASNTHSGQMAVIVQEMVDPVISGVAFSRNPVTGLSDIVVEAIEGRGDALLQDGVDALRWTYRNGELVDQPRESGVTDELVMGVVAETERLAAKYGPADLEWVWDGEHIHMVQIRPITTIGDVPIYSRRISKDVMPGMIKPLVWSINVPMVNSAWVRLFTEAIGPNDLDPDSLARSFAYRSYFDMRAIGDIFEMMGMPRDSLENLLGLPGARGRMRPGPATFLKLPRMIGLVWRLYRGHSWIESRRRDLHMRLRGFDQDDLRPLGDAQLLEQIARLTRLGEEAAYLNIVAPLLANAHVGRLKRALARIDIDFEDIDAFPTSPWDPAEAVKRLGRSLRQMEPSLAERAAAGDLSALDEPTAESLDRLISEFGYLSENNNDLSIPRWRDARDVPLRIAASTMAEANRSQSPDWNAAVAATTGRESRRLSRLHSHALDYQVLREATGATFAYGYGLLRPRYLELGRRLVENGSLAAAEDVFYVERDRATDALADPEPIQADVARVKSEMEAVADLLMPEMIVGDEWVPESTEVSDRLTGVGASRGRYRGRARLVEQLSESSKLQDGEVLVVEYSDVAWTPLFSRAGAVVTAAGGMLAHSSITAREMGIPCVASVPNARLLDGAQVLVDGFTGEVLVESEHSRDLL